VEQVEDAVSASLGVGGEPVVAGGGGQRGLFIRGLEDGDVEAGDGAAAVGTAVVLAFGVPGSLGDYLINATPLPASRPGAETPCHQRKYLNYPALGQDPLSTPALLAAHSQNSAHDPMTLTSYAKSTL
jgi:hypothetical protein